MKKYLLESIQNIRLNDNFDSYFYKPTILALKLSKLHFWAPTLASFAKVTSLLIFIKSMHMSTSNLMTKMINAYLLFG